ITSFSSNFRSGWSRSAVFASGRISRLNARIARFSGFFAVAASVTSRRETGPIRANLIGIEACLDSYARPSRDPIASALTRIPSSCVSMWTWDSFATSSMTAARSPFTARIGAPATAFSSPLPTILTPEADQGEQQVRDAFAELRADRDDRQVRREVLDPVVAVCGEAVLEQAADELIHPTVEFLAGGVRLILVRADEGLAFVLPPPGHHVDLVRGDDERRLVAAQDVQALDRLRAESFVDVDHEDREVREGAAASPQRREGDVARRVDEEEAGDLEGSSLDEVPAHLEDRRERDLRRADVLGDPAGLAARDAGTPDPVEEGRLAMVHVSQDGHDGLANGSHRHRTKNPSILEGCGPGSSAEPLCRRNMPSWRGTGYRHG